MVENIARSSMSRGVRSALRGLQTEFYIQRQHRVGVKRASRLSRNRPLRLNLGSGFKPTEGWINVDLSEGSDASLDLREKLPFQDSSVEEIYCEHFLEHLSYPDLHDSTAWEIETARSPSEALSLLRECRRVLVPGGILDVVVPDVESILREYLARHDVPFPMHAWWGPKWCDTPLHCVNYVFRQGREHNTAYDEETLQRVLESVGFVEVRRRAFNPAKDAPNHEIGSLCMLAVNPSA